LAYVQRDEGLNGNDAVPEGGMLAVLKANVGDIPVLTNTAVTKVEQIEVKGKAVGYRVTANGKTFVVRYLISTVPPNVLASGKIEFDPPLPPKKLAALKASKMGLLNKVVMELDDEFDFTYKDGRVQQPNEELLVKSDAAAAPVSVLMQPNGKKMMIGFVGGDEAWRLENAETPDAAMVAYFVNKLQPAFKSEIYAHIKAVLVTHWGKEGGSYSYIEPGKNHLRQDLAKPVGNFYTAGEAFAPPGYFEQQVPAAAKSGQDAAKAILAKRKQAQHHGNPVHAPPPRIEAAS
jgi:monoamine oxidase